MKRSDRFEKAWLADFANEVAQSLVREISDPAVELITKEAQLKPEETDTNGWVINMGRLEHDRSNEFQIWLDHYPNVGRRMISVCYMATKLDRIEQVADAGSGELGPPIRLDDEIIGNSDDDGNATMVKPLKRGWFNKPIAELYNRCRYRYYGVYLDARIEAKSRPPKQLIKTASNFLSSVIRSAAVVHLPSAEDFPDVPNRSAVRRHRLRERPGTKWTDLAKRRDSFTCQVCGINFVELYSDLGRGYAEAHHIIPLSSPRARKVTNLCDLITVCANCHRMLHRNEHTTVKRLRKLFTSKWPERRIFA